MHTAPPVLILDYVRPAVGAVVLVFAVSFVARTLNPALRRRLVGLQNSARLTVNDERGRARQHIRLSEFVSARGT
jgi:hypothetical protein